MGLEGFFCIFLKKIILQNLCNTEHSNTSLSVAYDLIDFFFLALWRSRISSPESFSLLNFVEINLK